MICTIVSDLRICCSIEDSSTASSSLSLAFPFLLCYVKKVQRLPKKVSIEVLTSCKLFLVMTSRYNSVKIQDEFCTCYAVTSAVIQLRYYASDLLTSASKCTNDFHRNVQSH